MDHKKVSFLPFSRRAAISLPSLESYELASKGYVFKAPPYLIFLKIRPNLKINPKMIFQDVHNVIPISSYM